MASKPDASMPFLNLGNEQTEAMLSMQNELLDAYDQSSRAWLARVKSEVELWSDLAKRLSAVSLSRTSWGLISNASRSGCKWLRKTGGDFTTTAKRSRKRSRGHCRMDGRP